MSWTCIKRRWRGLGWGMGCQAFAINACKFLLEVLKTFTLSIIQGVRCYMLMELAECRSGSICFAMCTILAALSEWRERTYGYTTSSHAFTSRFTFLWVLSMLPRNYKCLKRQKKDFSESTDENLVPLSFCLFIYWFYCFICSLLAILLLLCRDHISVTFWFVLNTMTALLHLLHFIRKMSWFWKY